MRDLEKSYLEVKVTFHHILVFLLGVILIGAFLFYLGYQSGKSTAKNQSNTSNHTNKNKNAKEIILDSEDPDKLENVKDRSISQEMTLHQQDKKKVSGKTDQIKTGKAAKKEPHYTIQVAAFNSHTLAKNYSRKFSRVGYPTSITQANIKGQIWYRVRVGNFKTREEAIKEKKKLELLEKKKFDVIKAE
jgi:cell division protein FtsN